ncbi:para-nitrobenzyl esterase [Sphingomonas gellani]|uniref:Carboxylic ester hydrolase n=1 Tax=Sphingomonas gellani TaxID=1166340 RepID=A0A1H8DEV6_9SPHN|nr:carboxylesterase family protein [Sphingomonas gellani]SEN05635.1 para-nitrobenzyl esterase [Sphingomonas gellani]
MRAFLILAASSALAVAASAQSQDRGTRVTIDTGALRGSSTDGVSAFKGIPFAAPPVADLRWRAPQPAAKWSGERDATRYGNDCMQLPFPSDAAPLGTPPAEDCLYANVWKPTATKGKLPVLVWIYGGGFVNGGSSPPTYSGAELAKQGIVFASFNYRLGRFGTFAHPQLTRADADRGLLANYGYMDQLAALRWVRRNIAAFGGDPANVTIIGESAGGMSVHALVTSPLASGLFRKAVIQSGGPSMEPGATLADAEKIGVTFAAAKGIAADDPQALVKLRRLPADQLVDGLNLAAMSPKPGQPRTYSWPIVDGRIAVDLRQAYASGRFNKGPVMLGATSADIGGPSGYMINGARDMAKLFATKGVPTYYYRFSYVATSARTPATQGAGHATDIPFFFDTAAIKYGADTSATDRAAARTASRYLVNFVKSGDPAGAGLPAWPSYSVAKPTMLDLDAAGGAHTVTDTPAP